MINSAIIMYPEQGKVVRTIQGAVITDCMQSLGKNGWANTIGVQFMAYKGKVWNMLEVRPITSKGELQRCAIQFPSDPETLRQIALAIENLAGILEQNAEV